MHEHLLLHVYVCFLQLQAHFLVLDDIMDNSVTRRGRPCWYLYKNLGTAAVNDGILLEHGVYQLLRRYLRDKPYYINVLELFHDVSFICVLKYRAKPRTVHLDRSLTFKKLSWVHNYFHSFHFNSLFGTVE